MNKEFIFQNRKIFYRVTGTGKPVVLVHGFGEDGEIWNRQADHLIEKFKLIVPDLPGSGRSSADNRNWAMEDYAEMLSALVDQEAIDKCMMIGHSMGGYITLAFTAKYPWKLEGFGLFHSSAFADSDEKKATRRKGIDFIREHGAFEFLKTVTPNLFSPDSQSRMPQAIDSLIESLRSFTPDALVSYYQAMMKRPDRTSVLKSVKIPVLFVMGEHDTAIPISDVLKQCHLPEKSYIHILKNSGHMGMLEETEKSNRILDEFLLQTESLGTQTTK